MMSIVLLLRLLRTDNTLAHTQHTHTHTHTHVAHCYRRRAHRRNRATSRGFEIGGPSVHTASSCPRKEARRPQRERRELPLAARRVRAQPLPRRVLGRSAAVGSRSGRWRRRRLRRSRACRRGRFWAGGSRPAAAAGMAITTTRTRTRTRTRRRSQLLRPPRRPRCHTARPSGCPPRRT
jgi:hypothetical protein